MDFEDLDPEIVAQWLERTGQFKVLRKVSATSDFGAQVSSPINVLLIDTETTGLDFESSEMIELGAVLLEVDEITGQIGRVLGSYGGLEEPDNPIPEESTAIHGITNDMVAGQRFDELTFSVLVEKADLCVAHNAGFDKPFLQRRFEWMNDKVWACSFREVPWNQEGYGQRKLESLLAECGLFHGAHRAVEDCNALAYVLSTPLKTSHRYPFQVLFESANEPLYEIAALKAPFEKKDFLKARGFRWNSEDRVWEYTAIGFSEGKEIIEWLREQVYCVTGKITLGFRTQAGPERYSKQKGRQSFKDV